jgi:hypothetical protein
MHQSEAMTDVQCGSEPARECAVSDRCIQLTQRFREQARSQGALRCVR